MRRVQKIKLANLFCGYYQGRYGAAFGLPIAQVAALVGDVREERESQNRNYRRERLTQRLTKHERAHPI